MRTTLAALAAGLTLALCQPVSAEDTALVSVLDYDALDGWSEDRHADALAVFRQTCGLISKPEWPQLCALAETAVDARSFFEMFFRPVLIEDGADALFTGYFEPELRGSRYRGGRYQYPVYRMPNDRDPEQIYYTRAEIDGGALSGRGLEIAWVDDSVELFFLQIQGSGRIALDDGTTIRVGYAGHNGHPYQSVGQEMIRRGLYEPHQVSADVIKNWVRRNPDEGRLLLNTNPSFVFFRELRNLSADKGPLGAMNRSITTLRSIAVDPSFVPLGAPVWIEKDGEGPMRRLMIAQDTGSAIKGAQRADIFFGTGDAAGRAAGRIKDGGRMLVLMPIQAAYALEERVTG